MARLGEVGVAARPLHVQLSVPRQKVRDQQPDLDAIARLSARGVLPDVDRDRAVKRVMKTLELEY